MFKKLKYGIIGAGHLGNYHAMQINEIDTAILAGIYDIVGSNSLNLSKKYKTQQYLSLDKLIKDCDAVSIATPATNHFEVAKIALENNCHLFVEKPFTKTISEAQKLITLKNKKNLKIQVGHIERFNPAFIQLMNNKSNPEFIESHRLSLYNPRGTDVDVILDLMVHDIDLILKLVPSKIKNIYASGKAVLTDSVDLANSRIEFENGCTVNLTASRISLKQMRQMRIFEKRSYSLIDFNVPSLNMWKINKNKKLEEIKYKINSTNALYEELFCFVNSIQSDEKILVPAEEALLTLEIADKIQKIIE
jgi:predicted dehydrogenase